MTARELVAQLRAAVAEFGADLAISQLPTDTPLPADGYDATTPPIVGAAKSALVITETAHGIRLSLTAKQDGVDDVRRQTLKRIYAKRAKQIRETGTYPAATNQDTNND